MLTADSYPFIPTPAETTERIEYIKHNITPAEGFIARKILEATSNEYITSADVTLHLDSFSQPQISAERAAWPDPIAKGIENKNATKGYMINLITYDKIFLTMQRKILFYTSITY